MEDLKVAANFPNPPFFYTKSENDSTVINGLDYHFIKTITKKFNISYEFIHANWKWGNKINGTWNGMIGKVVNKSANMALGVLTSNYERQKVVDFTIPYYYTDITFVMRMIKKSSINANSLLIEPFDIEVWICLLFSVIFSVFIMKLVKQEIKQTLLFTIRGILQQGAPTLPRVLRPFASVWFLLGLILSQTYVSVIFLYMSKLIPKPEISSITELALAVKSGRIIPSTSSEGSLFKLIKGLKTYPLNSIGEALIGFPKTNDALKQMLSVRPQLTYICPRLILYGRIASFGVKNLYLPPESDQTNFLMEQLVIALPKNYANKTDLNNLIRRLESTAHFKHWERVSLREKSNFKNRTNYANFKIEEKTEEINLKTVQFILYLWMSGLLIAICLVLIELVYKKLFNKIPNLSKRRLRRQRAFSEPFHRGYIDYIQSLPRISRMNTD